MKWLFGRRAALIALAAAVLVAPASAAADRGGDHDDGGNVQLVALSDRPDLVSGGDVLVQVVLPRRVSPSSVHVSLNGADVTSSFALRSDGRFVGLVTGLRNGDNVLVARTREGSDHLVVTNFPNGGPIFAGPQVQPWICNNASLGLAPPSDAQCDSPTTFSYVYMSSVTHTFKPWTAAATDVATTTTDQGVTVPYIVRVERGAMDRGIYDVAVLDNPAQDWAPWASQSGWNHKLVWAFGASTAPHHSNGAPQPVLVDMALSRGFMVANNSLNTRGQNANDVVSAESMLMLKEHIAETYGSIRYTIGTGCSGGSIEQYVLAADYPGLVDGIQPNCSYQDSLTTGVEVADCGLLTHYFSAKPTALNPLQQAAIEDTKDISPCLVWDATFFPVGTPSLASNCDMQAPPYAAMVYNPVTNPRGVRCDVQDYQVAIWGLRPPSVWGPVEQSIGTGFAKRPFDNVGVQYGLNALRAGTITPEQFVQLNANVGGVDIDNNFQPARTASDPGSLPIAYRTGTVTSGFFWGDVPIIDLRGSHNVNDIHTDYHSYVARARLDQTNGTHANQIIWTWQGGPGLFQNITPSASIALKSFLLMDRWLTNIENDRTRLPLRFKVIRDKPSDAVDACFTNPADASSEVTDTATCQAMFPHYGDARLGAGEGIADNILKCRLVPLNAADYAPIAFTADQWTRLQQAFPDGVCDYSRRGVDQQPSIPWLGYADGPGGRPLGPSDDGDK